MKRFLPLLLVCLTGCASQGQVDVYLVNITPMPSTLFEQRARLDLRFQNLDTSQIVAEGVEVSIKLNGKRWARGVAAQPITVPKLGEAQTSVVVSSSLFDTITQLLGLRERETFDYGLQGKLFTSGRDHGFRRSGEISRADLDRLAGGARPAQR